MVSSRRLGWISALSLLTGLTVAVLAVAAPAVPARTSTVAAAVLLALGLGWLLLALLSAWLTDRPQWWALAPAAFCALGATVTLTRSAPVDALWRWSWPGLLLILAGWMLLRVRRRMTSRIGRWLLYPVIGCSALIAVAGAFVTVSETVQRSTEAMPGRLVDVGDHKLHLSCTGSGTPTVVLEPGLGGDSTTMHWIAPAVAADTRVCVYDRAGRGWSEHAEGSQSAGDVAADLHTLLARAHVPGPYVLAGHSFGGLYGLAFAHAYPGQVAGLVLLDSTSPAYGSAADPSPAPIGRLAILLPSLGGFTGSGLASFGQEFLEGSASVHQAASLTDLGHTPLIVVTADTGHDTTWRTAQRRLASLSANSEQRIVHATHQSLVDDAAASGAAAQGIRDVVASVRTSRPLREH